MSTSDSEEAEARLGALVEDHRRVRLAEVDLDLRGEGTIMGERQKGRSDLKLASLRRDREWVERAREVAFAIVDDPDGTAGGGLERHPDLLAEVAPSSTRTTRTTCSKAETGVRTRETDHRGSVVRRQETWVSRNSPVRSCV